MITMTTGMDRAEIEDALMDAKLNNPTAIVEEWQRAISSKGIPENYRAMTPQRQNLHMRLLLEETVEMFHAINSNDLENTLKEAADVLVIWSCIMLELGIGDVVMEVLRRVHDSNMSKVVNGTVVYRGDGKVLKGKSYKEPDFEDITRILRGEGA